LANKVSPQALSQQLPLETRRVQGIADDVARHAVVDEQPTT
jgi:hypothetical protein